MIPKQCDDKIVTDADCFPVRYPWDLLRMNEEVLALMDETSLHGEVSPLASLSGCIRIGNGTEDPSRHGHRGTRHHRT